jgi:hypothetical protein
MIRIINRSKLAASIILILLYYSSIFAQQITFTVDENSLDNDGPYVFFQKDSLLVLEIQKGKVLKYIAAWQETKHNLYINSISKYVTAVKNFQPERINQYTNISQYLIISDIHGQFDLFKKLLINNKITDDELNWIWGSGHLVIAGDVFDRGPGVTESLWLIFSLSQQAKLAGGKIHFLLGNHELMILENDLRYVNPKYISTAEILELKLEELYAENTLLGNWLRSKPVCLKINDDLIVHAGISPQIADCFSSPDAINESVYAFLNGNLADLDLAELLKGSLGPFWYRGYFISSPKYDLISTMEINKIMTKYKTERIIVGHTTYDDILTFQEDKIINVDAGIKTGRQGKALLWKDDTYFILDESGNSNILLSK